MTVIIAMAAASVAACLLTLSRAVGWKRILRHSTLIDVAFTLGLGVFLSGTLTGALVAVLGGLLMAVSLSCIKRLVAAASSVRSSCMDDEHDARGNWIYNEAPYA